MPITPPDVRSELQERVLALGCWFHNIDLHGVKTAPDHFLGDYPQVKWKRIRQALPADLAGASVLDVGCNAGFYSIALKQMGAGRVMGVDVADEYLAQARFAAATLDLDIEFEKRSVYEVDAIPGTFDYVLFMGVFYHLRYPLLALDKVATKVGSRLIFQSMLRGPDEAWAPAADYDFWEKEVFAEPRFPAAYFIENAYAHDQTNWFIPNRSGAEAMLRSAGLAILAQPEHETWICAPERVHRGGRTILEMELDGTI